MKSPEFTSFHFTKWVFISRKEMTCQIKEWNEIKWNFKIEIKKWNYMKHNKMKLNEIMRSHFMKEMKWQVKEWNEIKLMKWTELNWNETKLSGKKGKERKNKMKFKEIWGFNFLSCLFFLDKRRTFVSQNQSTGLRSKCFICQK